MAAVLEEARALGIDTSQMEQSMRAALPQFRGAGNDTGEREEGLWPATVRVLWHFGTEAVRGVLEPVDEGSYRDWLPGFETQEKGARIAFKCRLQDENEKGLFVFRLPEGEMSEEPGRCLNYPPPTEEEQEADKHDLVFAKREDQREQDLEVSPDRLMAFTRNPRNSCVIETDGSGRGRVLVDGVATRLSLADPQSEYAGWVVFEAAAAASQTHVFLHASSVIVDGQAALFIGPTGRGKSTLAKAMVAQGAEAHNDDVTPIERASGLAERFPKGDPAADWQALRVPIAAAFFLTPREADHATQPDLRPCAAHETARAVIRAIRSA